MMPNSPSFVGGMDKPSCHKYDIHCEDRYGNWFDYFGS